jgi:hypothetical protein
MAGKEEPLIRFIRLAAAAVVNYVLVWLPIVGQAGITVALSSDPRDAAHLCF